MESMVVLNEYEYGELKMTEHERDQLLMLMFKSIMNDHYIDPIPIINYMRVFYPNRLKRRLEEMDAQADESNKDSTEG